MSSIVFWLKGLHGLICNEAGPSSSSAISNKKIKDGNHHSFFSRKQKFFFTSTFHPVPHEKLPSSWLPKQLCFVLLVGVASRTHTCMWDVAFLVETNKPFKSLWAIIPASITIKAGIILRHQSGKCECGWYIHDDAPAAVNTPHLHRRLLYGNVHVNKAWKNFPKRYMTGNLGFYDTSSAAEIYSRVWITSTESFHMEL